jgi:hypothetical protein
MFHVIPDFAVCWIALFLAYALGIPLLNWLQKLHDRPCRETRVHLKKTASMSPAMRRRYLTSQIEFYKSELSRKRIERIEKAQARRERFPFKQFHSCRVRFCDIRRFFFPSF